MNTAGVRCMRGLCHVALLCVLGALIRAPRVGAFGPGAGGFAGAGGMSSSMLPMMLGHKHNEATMARQLAALNRAAPCFNSAQNSSRGSRGHVRCCPVPKFVAHLFVRCKGGAQRRLTTLNVGRVEVRPFFNV